MKRRRKEKCTSNSELSDILTKFVEVSEENATKRMQLEMQWEDRREQERRHEERMLQILAGLMQPTRMPQYYPSSLHYSAPVSPFFPPADKDIRQ